MTNIRILHFDQSEADSREVSARLAAAGLSNEILRVDSEAQFGAALKNGTFDLILCDHLETSFDGLAVIRAAAKAQPDVPFIFVTAFRGDVTVAELIKAGASDYVLKAHLDRLAVAVQRAFREVSERTARKAAEEELRSIAQELRSVTAHARCILWHGMCRGLQGWNDPSLKDWPTAQFEWNIEVEDPEAAQHFFPVDMAPGEKYITGWTRSRLAEDNWRMGRTSAYAFIRGDKSYSQEFRCSDRRGGVRWFYEDVSIQPIGPAHWKVFGVITNITERKESEEERIRLLALEQKARADAEAANHKKDLFLAVLSHELRTPLTPILAAVGLLKRNPDMSPEVTNLVEMIRRNGELEARLIDDLLDIARISNGKLELTLDAVDVQDALSRAWDTCQNEASAKSLNVQFISDAREHFVCGDGGRLQQIFWNLLSNAVKFTPSGGSIVVRTGNTDPSTVRISVADTGVGIEPDLMDRLFNAFEQGEQKLTRRFGGLGLGLTISKWLVDAHGGAIGAVSAGLGKGTTMTVDLPTTPSPATQPRISVAPPSTPRRERAKLLLVEDNEDTARAVARVLRTIGHDVSTANSVRAAMEVANSGEFDLLISDIGLPDGSGWELVRRLTARGPLRAIALSGFGSDDDIRKSRQAGFAEHLVKPVTLQRLQTVIDRILATVE